MGSLGVRVGFVELKSLQAQEMRLRVWVLIQTPEPSLPLREVNCLDF